VLIDDLDTLLVYAIRTDQASHALYFGVNHGYIKVMEIKSAVFIKGIIGTDDIMQQKIPHVAFVGRSNVGKSSVINSLLDKKGLVKSSATPGKTKEINFFLVNENRFFVDLPGYGFACMSANAAEKLRKLILWYLVKGRSRLSLVVLIVDASIEPMPYDEEMVGILRNEQIPFLIVANKIDRLNQSERAKNFKRFESVFVAPILLYSTKTKEGRDVLAREAFRG
jgi:GTP-binding protein